MTGRTGCGDHRRNDRAGARDCAGFCRGRRGCGSEFAGERAGGCGGREIEALGRRTLRVVCDVLDRASIQGLHDAVIEEFGKVDILVNAAGMAKKVATLDEEEGEWSKIIDTNLTGTMRACQIFGRTMVECWLRAHH